MSASETQTRSGSVSSTSATIWAITVRVPLPSSWKAPFSSTDPSSQTRRAMEMKSG